MCCIYRRYAAETTVLVHMKKKLTIIGPDYQLTLLVVKKNVTVNLAT